MRSWLLILLGLSTAHVPAEGATRHVHPSDPLYPTIQAAIDSSVSGDSLLISPGTWAENPLIVRKNLTLMGSNAGTVILDAAPGASRNNSGCVLRTVSSRVELRHLTLRNGVPPVGAGVFMFGGTLDVRHCRLEDNEWGIFGVSGLINHIIVEDSELHRNGVGIQGTTATRVVRTVFDRGRLAFQPIGNFELQDVEVRHFGTPGDQQAGALDLSGSQGTLERVLVEHNWSDGALGGIWMSGGTFLLRDVTVRHNTSTNGPAGIGMDLVPSADLENVVIEHNVAAGAADHGIAGLLVRRSNATARHCRFNNNHSEDPGGGVSVQVNANLRLENSEVLHNRSDESAGGLYVVNGTATLQEVTIGNNEAQVGGGIFVSNNGRLLADQITVAANRADIGGGVFHLGGDSEIRRSIIAWHPELEAIFCNSSMRFECVDVFGNGKDEVCGTDGGSNLSEDPLFCSLASAAFDLGLQSASPVADTGSCGRLGALPIGCSTTAVQQRAWTTVKQMYR